MIKKKVMIILIATIMISSLTACQKTEEETESGVGRVEETLESQPAFIKALFPKPVWEV